MGKPSGSGKRMTVLSDIVFSSNPRLLLDVVSISGDSADSRVDSHISSYSRGHVE